MTIDAVRRVARAMLPASIRKPIADAAYRILDRVRAARHRAGLGWAEPLPAARAGQFGRAVTGLAATAQLAVYHAIRQRLYRHLPLLRSPHPRGVDRLRRHLLIATLERLDRRYERQFRALLDRVGHRNVSAPATGRRLCVVIGTLGPGGAERQATNTVVGLAGGPAPAIDVLVTYLEHDWQRFFAPAIEAAGVRVDAVQRASDPIALLRDCDHPDAARLAGAIAATLSPALHDVALYTREFLLRRPDLVHLWLDEVNVRAGLAAAIAGVPRIVLGTRSLNPSHFPLFQPYMRSGYRALTALGQVTLLNNSATGARDYERWIGLPAGTCTVLRNGFDFDTLLPADPVACRQESRQRLGIPDEAIVVGGVMRFSEEKRPLFWLDTADLVLRRHPGTRFLLVGDGVLREEVAARATQPPLAGAVVLPGHDSQAYATMSAMDVLFLSSIHEGLPNVLIEAQALGVPVVTTPAGGAAETLAEGESGWVVHGNTPRAAADIIGDLIGDPARLRRAGAIGRAFARDRFGYERLIEETVAVYGGAFRPTAGPSGTAGGGGGGVGDA